jgi:superfamily II DNA or RNA helicase
MPNPFQNRLPNVGGNQNIRTPQREAYQALVDYASNPQETEREVGIVLPVGCGKSGCITLAPFAFRSIRTLVVAPGLHIAGQLAADFNPTNAEMFYQKCHVLNGAPYPEPVEIRGTTTNRADLDEAAVVITNIHQLQGETNRWLQALPVNYFDLILFDEGHHSVADSWETLRTRFPNARIVNFSATPLRADGQIMAGRVLYSYPIFRAIQEGYVKRLKAVQLNPRTLRYVRREDGEEIEVDLAEVRRLGETEADFRRSIVTSQETLNTIVDASIRELDRLRADTGEARLKIIASALNFQHCGQIVEAYAARGRRAGYVHSREDSASNQRVMQQLENHQLDVIVQVRKLGEGFDHRFLAVAAVFSIFSNLSPFVQFVGRIMRVIVQNAPGNIVNQGVVVFHAGANIARQWGDFQQYSEADQAYFDQLLPLEGLDLTSMQTEREIVPHFGADMEVRAQSEVQLEEIHLLEEDEAAAIRLLQERGIIAGDFDPARQALQPVPTTRVAQRQAMRGTLDMRVRTEAAKILNQRGVNPAGRNLDRQRLGRDNLIVLKSAIDRQVNAAVGRTAGQRHEFSRTELDLINSTFSNIVATAVQEIFNGN